MAQLVGNKFVLSVALISQTICFMETTLTTENKKTASIFSAENIIWGIAHLFVIIFLITAIIKLKNPDKFWGTLNGSQLLKPFADFLTYAVPIVELILCVFLLKKSTRKKALVAGGVLLLSFTIYIGLMLSLYGNDMPCSCGGFVEELSWTAHIFFNLAFVGLAWWAMKLYKRIEHT